MMMRRHFVLSLLQGACIVALPLLMGCTDQDEWADAPTPSVTVGNTIRIGGVNAETLVAHAAVTRATNAVAGTLLEDTITTIDAERVPWLVNSLKKGLDITYGDADNRAGTSQVAFLQLQTDNAGNIKYSAENLAEYTFMYRDKSSGVLTTDSALWYDNGSHFFEGIYMPERIGFDASLTRGAKAVYDTGGTAEGINTDQHDDNANEDSLGNYNLLAHYLAMPPNTTINATVGRIKLPFRHRLARVLAYILIDPEMGNVTLKGYKKDKTGASTTTEDPTTTDIKFCNVDVLAGVKDSCNATKQLHFYTPQWKTERKVIPHFVGERGSYDDSQNLYHQPEHQEQFIAYYHTQKKYNIYPTDEEWTTINALTEDQWVDNKTRDGVYERITYGKVPVYDLIVRPTYTSTSNVMYDEDTRRETASVLAAKKNQIDFEVTLSNDLNYTKKFVFDLDANYQTVVYLHISREKVNYNQSGSELWQETKGNDHYYGVNNLNGNTLSIAGSSWQRAYTNGATNAGHPDTFTDHVTDGHLYTGNSEDEAAQYLTNDQWLAMFYQAYKGGAHHGDYFILHNDITINTDLLPATFSGHLDAQEHIITLTGSKAYLFEGLNGNYLTPQEPDHDESDASKPWEANVHKEQYGNTTYWVPYRCATDGWRAEIINAKVTGGSLFRPHTADFTPTITGYVHNCWEYSETDQKYVEHPCYTPTIPQY